MVLPPQLSLNIYRNQTISCIINTTRGIMPKVAINDEHICLYDRDKTTWLFFFLQTLQLKLQNVVTHIQRNKICVLNKNVGIHLTLSYQTNSTSSQIRHS